MTKDTQWRLLGSPPPSALADARDQLHHAVQLLASFGQTLASPKDDDSHRSTTWDAGARAFRSTPAASPPDVTALVAPDPFEVRVDRNGDVTCLPLPGKTLADAYAWLEGEMGTDFGRPEFEIPAHAVGSGAAFDADPAALAELARWYGNAAMAFESVRSENEAADALRCWPHHFDLATLIVLPGTDNDGQTRTVGVGMSPGDASYPQPYAYVNPWPYPWDVARPELPAGHWHAEGWLGAVLTADGWTSGDSASEQEAQVMDVLRVAISAAKALLKT